VLRYDYQTANLTLDRRRSSLTSDVWRDDHHAPLALKKDEPLALHIFLDASVIEVFANNRRSITSRIYPVHPDSLGIAIATETDPLDVLSFRAWQMADIW
jgi:Beta-fructosidases (levanase/invertase)